MRRKRFLILFCGSLFVAALLALLFAPFLVATGLRLWMTRVGVQQGLQIETERIEAPFLRPAIIHKLRLSNGANAPFQIDGSVSRVEIDLDLRGIVFGSSRPLRALSAEGVVVNIRRNPKPAAASQRFAWPVLQNLLSNHFKLSGVQLHVENGNTIVNLRDGVLTGSQMESGVFTASEVAVDSPWFQKSFSNLRGATSWQEHRLVVGALSLMRGLDLDTITVDLSAIDQSRIGLEMHLDAFGGKVRARVSSDDRGDQRIWDVAGDGAGISLAQMSDTLAWTNRASGSIHACKFTFRGEAAEVRNATASIWAEVSGLTWRDRTADTVMIGAALYNREVQVQQLYIKQRENQLTLSGEFALPAKSADWIKPAFRGDISAQINDLGDFARLFGWSPSDFAGRLLADGSVSLREQKIGGQLNVSGSSLILFRAPIESVNVNLGLEESRLSIAQFELTQKEDFFRAQGDFALTGERSYNAAFQTSVADIADYSGLISRWIDPWALGGTVSLDWTGSGGPMSDSGTFHAHGRNLRVQGSSIRPFDAELEAEYSPENIFFRRFHFWNQRADLSAFVSVASDYIHLQALLFALNGQPHLQGNAFLPFSLAKLRRNTGWLAALSADPTFDVEVALDSLDLGELAAAVSARDKMSGKATGRIQLYGKPASLEGNSELHLRDFVFEHAPAISGDVEAQLSDGVARGKANVLATRSDAVRLEGSLALRLEKSEAGHSLDTSGPLAATLNFPAISLAQLPRYLSREIFTSGVLSGDLRFSHSLQHPNIVGHVDVVDARFLRGFLLSSRLSFDGQTAEIPFAALRQGEAYYSARAHIDFRDLNALVIKARPSPPDDTSPRFNIIPAEPLAASPVLEPGDCVRSVELSPIPLAGYPRFSVDEVELRGSYFAWHWTISLIDRQEIPAAGLIQGRPEQTFQICRDNEAHGKTLTIGYGQLLFP